MGYNRIKTVRAGRLVCTVCYTAPMASDPPRERAGKTRISTAARRRINHRAAWQKLEQLLAANFARSDAFATLTYDDGHLPADREAAAANMRRFLRRLRGAFRRRGEELRYIYVTESVADAPGEPGRLHHHLVCSGGPAGWQLIQDLWRAGQVYIEPLLDGPNDGYEVRARYLVKERQPGTPGRLQGARAWTPSRGLEKPEITTDLVPDTMTVTAPPGAFILEQYGDMNCWGSFLFLKYLLPESPPSRSRRGKEDRRRRRF